MMELLAFLPIAPVDGLTLDAFLPPAIIEEISWSISALASKLTDPY